MKHLAALSLLVISVVLLLSCGGGDSAVDEPAAESAVGLHPVVIIAVDGLRADALGCYGGPAATPALDALAAEAVRFEWAFAQAPEMMPSLASVVSGLYPTTHGMLTLGDDLEAEAVTLAEVAGQAGMTTAAFVEGAPGSADFGLAQGFASYQTVATPGVDGVAWMQQHADESFLLLIAGWGSRTLDGAAEMLGEEHAVPAERVVEVLASRGGDDPQLFDDAEMARVRDWYAARTQLIDAFFGEFMSAFSASGLADRATLVVLGSNGFALAEHGDLFGETVYAPVTRIPMMIRFPGGANAGVSDKVVEALDLMPTVVERLGVELPAGVQGSSLMPVIDGSATPPYVAFGGGRARVVSVSWHWRDTAPWPPGPRGRWSSSTPRRTRSS